LKIYIIFTMWQGDQYVIECIFSTKELAENYIAEHKKSTEGEQYNIDEWDVIDK